MIGVSALGFKQKADELSPTAEGYSIRKSLTGCSAFGQSKQGCVSAPHSQPTSVTGAKGRRASAIRALASSASEPVRTLKLRSGPWCVFQPTGSRRADGTARRRSRVINSGRKGRQQDPGLPRLRLSRSVCA
jgi:hypothetical protein